MSFFYYPQDSYEYAVPTEYYIDASGFPERSAPRRQPSIRHQTRRARPDAALYTTNELDLYDLARREAMRRAELQARHQRELALEKEREQERERRRRAQAEAERQAAYRHLIRQRQIAIERAQAEKLARAEARARRERENLENVRWRYAQHLAEVQNQNQDPFESLIRALSPFPVQFVESPGAEPEQKPSQPESQTKSVPFLNDHDAVAETVASSDDDDDKDYVDVTPGTPVEDSKQKEPIVEEPVVEQSEPEELNQHASTPEVVSEEPESNIKHNEDHPRDDAESEPRHKHHRRKHHRSRGKRSVEKQEEEADAHNIALLDVLHTELVHLTNVYTRVSTARPTDNLNIARSLLQVLEDTQMRTETVYNKLDDLKVSKKLRSVKHDLTKGSVELADKLDEVLTRQRKAVSELNAAAKSQSESSDTESVESDSSSDSFKSASNRTPKHRVMLEDVQDASDF